MQRIVSLFLFTVLVAAIGCRSDPHTDVYFDLLNTEKRVLEDRVYQLEYENEKLQKELQTAKVSSNEPSPPKPASLPAVEDDPYEVPDDLPDIELPPGFDDETNDGTMSLIHPASIPSGAGSTVPGPEAVTSIRINTRKTGGIDLDGKPGDDGISVLIEPRDGKGHFLAQAGDVSLVLLDPAKQGDAARLGKWDFDADVAAKAMTTERLDRGILLRVPWSDPPPESSKLHLFARLTTQDGQQIEADRLIEIHLADLVAQRWTPRISNGLEATGSPVVHASWDGPLQPIEPTGSAESGAGQASDGRSDSPRHTVDRADEPRSTAGSLWSPDR